MGYNSKTIVVSGTGLSTQGTLNFQNNLLSAEPEAVLDLLEEKNEIPDLTGMTVVWQQLGDVAAPHQSLTQSQKARLQEIIDVLPGLKSPTIIPLADEDWCSVHTVLDQKRFWEIIGKLKDMGAQGILVTPIEKMIL